jgi:hypothetical protein
LALGEFDRAEHVGRLVDEIAGEHDALGDRHADTSFAFLAALATALSTTVTVSLADVLRRFVVVALLRLVACRS